jgi:hypothetical protein
MTAPAIFTGSESFVHFLAAYPYPAFVLDARADPGKCRTPLQPVYGNRPYLRLIFGPEYIETAAPQFPLDSAPAKGLEEAIGDVNEARKLVAWCQRFPLENDQAAVSKADHTIVLSLQPPWLRVRDEAVVLVVTKTLVDNFWVCTGVPREAELPMPRPLTTFPPQFPSISKSRRTSPKLRLPNFPPPPTLSHIHQQNGNGRTFASGNVNVVPLDDPGTVSVGTVHASGSSADSSTSAQSAQEDLYDDHNSLMIFPKNRVGEMERMVESFPWETTDLGPKEGWSQALRTALSVCLRSPVNVSDESMYSILSERAVRSFASLQLYSV